MFFADSRRRFFDAFTLIELLVVIAIIAILASLAFPAFQSVQRAGQQTKCLHNMRQLGIGVLQFAGDHDGTGPTNSPPWDANIAPYIGISAGVASALLKCPADARELQISAGTFARSYALSEIRPADLTSGMASNTSARRLPQLIHPVSTIMLTEWFSDTAGRPIANYQFRSAFGLVAGWVGGERANNWPRLADGQAYHGKTMNFCFADGHAESLSPAQANTPANLWVAAE